jgi:HAD superfamily hydrolase (TIGR01509 family)
VMDALGRTNHDIDKAKFNTALDRLLENPPELFQQTGASRRDLLWFTPDQNYHREVEIYDWVNKIRISAWAAVLGMRSANSELLETSATLMANTVPQLISPMPGAVEAIELVPHNIKIIAVTNGFASHQRRKLKLAGLFDRFDGIVTSAEAGASKPSPALFKLALELSETAPEEAIMIGDSAINDVAGAKSFGIDAIQVAGELPASGNSKHGDALPNIYTAVETALNL